MIVTAFLILALASDGEPRIVAPRADFSGQDVSSCLSRRVPSGVEGQWTFEFMVEADGTAKAAPFQPGTEMWQKRMTECLLARARFTAGTVDGSPVAAKVAVPIALIRDHAFSGTEIECAKLHSTSEEVEDAYRACYPQDSLAMETAHYGLTIDTDGAPRKVKLVESSGDAALDQAGLCIIERLRFRPALRGSRPVKSSIVLPLPLRPAR